MNHPFLIAGLIVALIIGFVIWSQSGPESVVEPTAPAVTIAIGTLPGLGSLSAPVKIVEFGDYGCTFCGAYFKETILKIREEFVDKGLVQWYWRDFPTLDTKSVEAAAAARCAAAQNAFWPYRDKLIGETLETVKPVEIAENLGLEIEEFESCLRYGEPRALIEEDAQAARGLGVQAVPTFFINGERIVGAQPYEILRAAIERQYVIIKESL